MNINKLFSVALSVLFVTLGVTATAGADTITVKKIATFTGASTSDSFGSSVAVVGDINGDGSKIFSSVLTPMIRQVTIQVRHISILVAQQVFPLT